MPVVPSLKIWKDYQLAVKTNNNKKTVTEDDSQQFFVVVLVQNVCHGDQEDASVFITFKWQTKIEYP